MGYDNKEGARWITVEDLQRLLADDALRPGDQLHPNMVGNLLIVRNEKWVGFIDIPFTKIEWFED